MLVLLLVVLHSEVIIHTLIVYACLNITCYHNLQNNHEARLTSIGTIGISQACNLQFNQLSLFHFLSTYIKVSSYNLNVFGSTFQNNDNLLHEYWGFKWCSEQASL